MSITANLIAAKICRIPDKNSNEKAISLALAPFLRRYPKSIRGINIEDVGGRFQNLTVQVDAANMAQAQEMNAYLNGDLLVKSGFTSSNYIDALARAALDETGGADLTPRRWWQFWK